MRNSEYSNNRLSEAMLRFDWWVVAGLVQLNIFYSVKKNMEVSPDTIFYIITYRKQMGGFDLKWEYLLEL